MSKKRKRNEDAEDASSVDGNEDAGDLPVVGEAEGGLKKVLDETETVNVQKKIFHAIKETGRAFKKARDFEIRKIIKRIKASEKDGSNPEKTRRLEKELHIAKTIDVQPFAHIYVHKQLLTEDFFKDNLQLLHDHNLPEPKFEPGEEGITKNLVGRLSSAAAVKSAFVLCLNAIHRAAGIELPYNIPTARQRSAAQGPSNTRKSPPSGENLRSRQPPSPTNVTIPPKAREAEDNADDESDESENPSLRSDIPSIASPSASPNPVKRKAILPALSTGYIPADDLSDPDEEIKSFAPLAKPRKNRRGQRERRGIWLKKYGADARHLHPELKADRTKDAKKTGLKKSADGVEEGAPTEEAPTKKAPQELHPSWVAKQKLREQQKAIMTAKKPQKIVFD